MTILAIGTMTQPQGWVVCVFLASEGDWEHESKRFSSEHVARETAESIARDLRHGRLAPRYRSVSIRRPDGTWETVGTVYDIPKDPYPEEDSASNGAEHQQRRGEVLSLRG